MHITSTLSAALAALFCTASIASAQSPSLDSASLHAFPRRTLVQVDSVRIEIGHDTIGWKIVPTADCFVLRPDTSVHGGSARVRVLTPTGSFAIRGDSATIAAWADSAAMLRAPVVMKLKRDGKAELSLSGVILREANGATVMRLVRLTSDTSSRPAYQLDASNGAWGGRVRLEGALALAFFDALRGAVPPTVADADGELARFDSQVDVPAQRLGGPTPIYPMTAQQVGVQGDVRLSFIVGADGRAEPGSLEINGDAIPEFAVAVRESVMRSRYSPATKNGQPVRMAVQQQFSFRID